MPSFTKYFGIGFFDFGDEFGIDYSGQIEIDRFVFIDKQLYGLMSIFGNGVIDGWVVSSSESFSVEVSEGYGNINYIASRTEFPESIDNLTPNSVTYIYAKNTRSTLYDEGISFVTSSNSQIADPNFLLLAKVTVGNAAVDSVDNSVRTEIGFWELIKAAIRQHKHRGGSLYPSKIDLSSEVKGQLPSFRIADFDAEKITSGTFNLKQMPFIDHQDLQNVGLLTHSQLDSFVKSLELSNKELFGEIGTSNLLQLIIAVKLIYEDPSSPYYITNMVDENMINELVVIPGITPNNRIDFDHTTAIVDLDNHEIRGVPPVSGTSFYVNYDSALAWNSAFLLQDVVISGDYVTLAFTDPSQADRLNIEGFESASCPGQILSANGTSTPCTSTSLFEKQIVPLGDTANITANANALDVVDGFYAGKFSHQQGFRIQYVKSYEVVQDWTNYETFSYYIKCLDQIHGEVKIYFQGETDDDKSIEYTLLDSNYVTSGTNGYEARQIDLTLIPFIDRIKKFVIYSDDITNPFTFSIDKIQLQRATLLPDSGVVKLRYSSNTSIVFSTIDWNSSEPSETSITVRARASNGTALLNRATFTPYLQNGQLINLSGSDIEIEITLYPNNQKNISPVLHYLRLLITSESEIDGYVVDTYDEFARGSIENIQVTSTPTVTLDTPVYVDSYYFALANLINQISSTGRAELGIMGSNAPISANQAFKAVEDFGTSGSTVTSSVLFEPRSVVRTHNRTFVISDTFNDRVLEFDEDNQLIGGIGSINYESDSELPFPVAASVDTRTGILYIVWSKSINFKTVNVSKITVQTVPPADSRKVQLVKDVDKILGYSTSELNSATVTEGQIMPIYLSDQNAGILQLYPQNNTKVFLDPNPETGAIVGGISMDSEIYKKLYSAKGIPCYVGKFAYVENIFCPTRAEKTSSGGFVICNATIAVKEYVFPESITEKLTRNTNPPSIIEFNSSNTSIFGSDIIKFSPFIPGHTRELGDGQYLIGGILPTGSPKDSTELDFRSLTGDLSNKQHQKDVLSDIFFNGTSPLVGGVVIYDRTANASTFQYSCPEKMLVADVDVDSSGSYLVAESSLSNSGRITKLDQSGNVIFSYGEGSYSLINSIEAHIDGSFTIST